VTRHDEVVKSSPTAFVLAGQGCFSPVETGYPMLTEIDLIIQPYSVKKGKSILDTLIRELKSAKWDSFQAAVAFARQSGNFPDLLAAMQNFMTSGGKIQITFGANSFGGDALGSDYEAIETLLNAFRGNPNAEVHLYFEKGRTFHPKLYLFSNEHEARAMLIIGSSNWSRGGLIDNVEANIALNLDLEQEEHQQCYQEVVEHLETYWREVL